MKLHRVEREVETFGLSETKGFQIKATAKAFEILSSGLYKDKITAILREISANARDAHYASGIPTKPFDVHLPTTLNPYLSIRDFGEGLSHPLMLKLYQTYFGSLKEETNDLIGGLGLGSKSPFSYTDSYTVVSRFGGEKRTYDLFKDENGEPQIALRSTEDLGDEETGLEVLVPLTNNHDAAEFAKKARHVFEHYPVKPNFKGGRFEGVVSYKTVLEGKGWKITDRSNHHYVSRGARAVMGVISYPIDLENAISSDDAGGNPLLSTARRVLQTSIDIDFNIGDLDITAGREELSYVKTTKAALRRRILDIAEELDALVQSKFTACKSLFEAKTLYGELFGHGSTLSLALGNNYTVKFKGTEITDTVFEINMEDFPKSKLILYKDSKRGSPKFTKDFKAPPPKDTTGYGYRDEREFKLRLDAQDRVPTLVFFDDLDGSGHHSARIFNMRATHKDRPKAILIQSDDKAELAKLRKKLDGMEIKNVSELPRPVYERAATTKAKLKVLQHAAKSRNSISGPKDGPWAETDVTVETGGIFVLTSRGRIMYGHAEDQDSRFSQVFLLARTLGLIEDKEDIVAVPLSMAKQFLNTKKHEGKWTNFFDLIKERGVEKLTPDIQQQIVNGRARSDFEVPGGRAHDFEPVLTKLLAGITSKRHPIAKFNDAYQSLNKNQQWFKWAELATLVAIEPKGKAIDLNAEWKLVADRYPMLRYAMEGYHATQNVPDMLAYIKIVDRCGRAVAKESTEAVAEAA